MRTQAEPEENDDGAISLEGTLGMGGNLTALLMNEDVAFQDLPTGDDGGLAGEERTGLTSGGNVFR